MKRNIVDETDDSETETESLIENTPRKMSSYDIENSSNVSDTSEELSRQIRAVTDPSRKN